MVFAYTIQLLKMKISIQTNQNEPITIAKGIDLNTLESLAK